MISGNAFGGLQIEAGDATDPEEEVGPGTGNEVKGNFIGTDATATIAIPNGVGFGLAGVAITVSDHNTIGGSEPGAGNVIAANDGEGLFIIGTGAEDNDVLGNWIGTTPAGAARASATARAASASSTPRATASARRAPTARRTRSPTTARTG